MRALARHLAAPALAIVAPLAVLAAACASGTNQHTQGPPPQSRLSDGATGAPASAEGGVPGYGGPAETPRAWPATATVPGSFTEARPGGGGADRAAPASGDPATASGAAAGAPAAVEGGTGVAVAAPTISIPPNETMVPVAATPTPTPGGRPTIGGCTVFPADNPWNQDISGMPVDANSATYIANIGGGNLHPDFGGGGAYGIPYIVVPQSQPLVPINFAAYGDESDPGPYPIPLSAPVEGGSSSTGDRHVLAVQQGTCKLYELYSAYPGAGAWNAGSGAVFDLSSNALRPDTWTSADAAGLPITAGLVRYDEVAAGQINHAVRFTVNTVRKAWVHPATHYGTSTSTTRIPYGAKLRLKASYDISGFHGEARVILTALKRYGMIVADQGSSWYITGDADPRWTTTT